MNSFGLPTRELAHICKKVESYCLRQGFFPCRRLLIALSGGADSVSLLRIMKELQARFGYELSVMHVNHMIRGEEADRDEAFCASLCNEMDVPFYSVKLDIPALAKAEQKGLEECARDHRYAALAAYADEISADRIATAHTATDQVETVLMQLIRGSAAASGMRPMRGHLIRPLLTLTREEIETYASENGLAYVEDSTNADDRYTRNFIRHTILPAIKSINPSAEEAFCRYASVRQSECDLLDRQAMRLIEACPLPDTLPLRFPLNLLRDAPKPIRARALALLCKKSGIGGLNHAHFEAMDTLNECGKDGMSLSLPSGALCKIEHDHFCLYASEESAEDRMEPLEIEPFELRMGENRLPDGSILFAYSEINGSTEKYIKEKQNIYNLFINTELDFGKIGNVIRVRSRLPGDRVLCRGMHRKVKKCFCDLHIPTEKRALQPILCDESGILWIPALKMVRDGTAPTGESASLLRLIYLSNG